MEVVGDDAPVPRRQRELGAGAARLRHPPPASARCWPSRAAASRRTCTSRSTARPTSTVLDALRDEIESVVDDVFAAVADWDALRRAVTEFADGLRAATSDRRQRGGDGRGRDVPRLAGRRPLHVRRRDRSRPDRRSRCPARSWVSHAGGRCSTSTTADAAPGRPAHAHPCAGAVHRAPRRAPRLGHRAAPARPTAPAVGELRLLGLYTANVFSDGVERIPVVRQKVAEVLERSGFAPDGHDGRALDARARDLPARRAVPPRPPTSWPSWRWRSSAWGCGGGCACS